MIHGGFSIVMRPDSNCEVERHKGCSPPLGQIILAAKAQGVPIKIWFTKQTGTRYIFLRMVSGLLPAFGCNSSQYLAQNR